MLTRALAIQPRGIGIDEETALLVLPDGSATMVGTGAAYFLQAPGPAQVLDEKTPMTYLNIGVYKLPQGGTFNFSTWTGTGGVAYTLNGRLHKKSDSATGCSSLRALSLCALCV